jgi:hypothetical protein
MKIKSLTLAFLFAAGVLAACHGVSPFTPQSGGMDDSSSAALARIHLPAPFDELASQLPNGAGSCTAPDVKIPGKYITMIAGGTAKGSTFTTKGSIVAEWSLDEYTKGTKPSPTPPTTPTPKGSPTPKPIKVWIYTGTWMTKRTKETGCATLITTQDGKPLFPGIGSGVSENSVVFKDLYVKSKEVGKPGSLFETFTGLSATGGHGSATLTSSKGKPYDTAVITLTGRISSKF